MKRTLLASFLLALSALAAYGQNAKSGQVLVEPPRPPKTLEQKPVPLRVPKPVEVLLGKSVFHQGYFMDLVRAQPKRALFDLRTPVDPEMDLENLIFDHDTDKVQAVVLFRFRF